MNAAAPFCRQAVDYAGLVQAVRDRTEQMEMSRLELDHIAGLTPGHSDKILRPWPGKKFGIMSLGAVLQTLGLVLVIMEDPAARDKTLARRTPFCAHNRRVGNHCHPKKLPAIADCGPTADEQPAAPPRESIGHAHLRVIEQRVKGGARWGGTL